MPAVWHGPPALDKSLPPKASSSTVRRCAITTQPARSSGATSPWFGSMLPRANLLLYSPTSQLLTQRLPSMPRLSSKRLGSSLQRLGTRARRGFAFTTRRAFGRTLLSARWRTRFVPSQLSFRQSCAVKSTVSRLTCPNNHLHEGVLCRFDTSFKDPSESGRSAVCPPTAEVAGGAASDPLPCCTQRFVQSRFKPVSLLSLVLLALIPLRSLAGGHKDKKASATSRKCDRSRSSPHRKPHKERADRARRSPKRSPRDDSPDPHEWKFVKVDRPDLISGRYTIYLCIPQQELCWYSMDIPHEGVSAGTLLAVAQRLLNAEHRGFQTRLFPFVAPPPGNTGEWLRPRAELQIPNEQLIKPAKSVQDRRFSVWTDSAVTCPLPGALLLGSGATEFLRASLPASFFFSAGTSPAASGSAASDGGARPPRSGVSSQQTPGVTVKAGAPPPPIVQQTPGVTVKAGAPPPPIVLQPLPIDPAIFWSTPVLPVASSATPSSLPADPSSTGGCVQAPSAGSSPQDRHVSQREPPPTSIGVSPSPKAGTLAQSLLQDPFPDCMAAAAANTRPDLPPPPPPPVRVSDVRRPRTPQRHKPQRADPRPDSGAASSAAGDLLTATDQAGTPPSSRARGIPKPYKPPASTDPPKCNTCQKAKWPVWRSNSTKFHCSECHPCMPMCSTPECRQDTWDGLWRGRKFLAIGKGFLCTGCWLAACSSDEEATSWREWFRERARRFPEHFTDPSRFDEGLC